MDKLKKTIFYDRHLGLKANMVEFGGWHMPLHYKDGIMKEHLLTRKECGLFDISHMGRFVFRGSGALNFLQYVLSNNVSALEPGRAQYTIIPDEKGGAIDDAYLYLFVKDEFLLVVNAANKQKDWDHFQSILNNKSRDFGEVELIDCSRDLAMLSLQGPMSKDILKKVVNSGSLPEPVRNSLSRAAVRGAEILISTTGYTGEPLCFELFVKSKDALMLWDILIENGACPVGLGARDTLRLEAGLPLYGHEFGIDPEGNQIPVFACRLAKFAVNFSKLKGDFIGRTFLLRQFEAFKKIRECDYSLLDDLPREIKPIALTERGIARSGSPVFSKGKQVGFITSGTMVPYWIFKGEGILSRITDETARRTICLALLDSDLQIDDEIEIEVRARKIKGVVVSSHLSSRTPPYARPLLYSHISKEKQPSADDAVRER